jgi:exopolyphosphatase/guanosine-5'-triphosphate,3'-diphosphate pyrophosphatase
MRITRLGQGVDATHVLAAEALERTFAALRDYRMTMDRHGVAKSRVVATSAVRDADNAQEFMSGVERITGERPEVLSGDEEGRLSFAGATAHLEHAVIGASPVLVVDIGGGSTELSVGRPAGGDQGPEVATRSLDIGCVRVSERFFAQDPPPREVMQQARQAVTDVIDGARRVLPALQPDSLLVGLAGTVSTLASLAQGVEVYERARIHHTRLSRRDVERWLHVLASEDSVSRLARPGMDEGREDVIVGGVLILAVVMSVFDLGDCLVSEDDILDGLAASLLPS